MNISGEVVILAPRQKLWLALTDPATLAQCIKGYEALVKIENKLIGGQVTLEVGSLKASFLGDLTVSKVVNGNSFTIIGQSKDLGSDFASGGADVWLEDVNDGTATRLSYSAFAVVRNQLAQLDSQKVDSAVMGEVDQFFARLAQRLAPEVLSPPSSLPPWAWIGFLLVAGASLLTFQLS